MLDKALPPSSRMEMLCRFRHGFPVLFISSCLFNNFLISANDFTPRGVSLSRAALYDPQKDFSCLDGSKLIPFSFVNDDYCDCPDGSDEPGTSACATGTFFCLNAAYKSTYIPATRVNDQICDCCDGSDEYYPNSPCPNTCAEMGRAAREEAEKQAQLAREGFQKRLEMSQKGKEIRKEKEEERSRLDSERQQAEDVKQEKLKIKTEREIPEKDALDKYHAMEEERKKLADEEEKANSRKEAEDMFNLIDSNEDGKITMDEMKVRNTFDRNKDGEVSDEEAMFFLNMETEMSKDDFLQSGWLIVKPYFLIEKGMFIPPGQEPADEAETDSLTPAEENPASNPTEPPAEDVEDDEAEDAKYPEQAEELNDESEDEESMDSADELTETEKVDPVEDKYDEATRALIDSANQARTEFDNAEKVVREISQKLQDVNDILSLDFGEDERFAPLHDQCFDFEDREYVYTLCPFKEATQRGRHGGGHVNLGKWGSWVGPEDNKYSQMLYDKGQSCWNGPARSAKVMISCGTDHRVTSVSEPSRCEYQMEFVSPVACEKPESAHEHDEL